MAHITKPPAWLLSSAGRRGSLVRFLREQPLQRGVRPIVVATDHSDLTAAGMLADVLEAVPPVRHESFISRTLEIAQEHNVKVIIPTIDPEIEVYARNRHLFTERGIDVWVSSPEVAILGWDKWELHNWLRANGLPSVGTAEVRAADASSFDGPVVAKPRNGSSSIGVIRADSVVDLALDDLDDDYIIQDHATGFEVTVDLAVGRDGRLLHVVPRRRIEVRGGEVSKGVTVDYPAVIALARAVGERLPGAYGALNVQVFYDLETGSATVNEINPRFGGGYPLSHLAGANFFDAILRDGRGERIDDDAWAAGTLMLRYDAEVIVSDFDVRSLDA